MSKFNHNQLLDYHNFLLEYPWKEDWLPVEVDGLLKVIEQLLDEGESK